MRLSNTTVRSTWLVVAIIGLLLAFATIYLQSNTTISLSDSVAEKAVTEALEHAYEVLDTPFDQLDLAQLSEVFVDHPDYLKEISRDAQAKITAQILEFLGPESAKNVGYLTSMKAKRVFQKQGEDMLKSALAKASAENRELTELEWQELAKKNHGLQPSLSDTTTVSDKRELKYFSIEIKGDKARARYDEGVTGRTAILVRIEGRWVVAGIF